MKTVTVIGPQHEMATELVAVPTVIARVMWFSETAFNSVFIQWYGVADSPYMPKNAQFFFDTMAGPGHIAWLGHPESFRVVFIGQIKHWVNPNAIDQLLKAVNGTPDTVIAWLMSPHGFRHLEPSSPMMQIVALGDPVCGIIEPRLYSDPSVKDAVMKEIEDGMSLGDRLARNYRMELPSEEIPWVKDPGTCQVCASFEHSHDEKPAVPPRGLGNCHSLSFLCPSCGRRWWQYNRYYHLWKHVTDPREWDSIRRQQILKDAGYESFED